jgi:hypothetical protein
MRRGPRTGRTAGQGLLSAAGLLTLLVIAAACGTVPPSGSSSPAASATPAASGSVASSGPGGSESPGPKPTGWPGNAVLGIEALGAADNQIGAAINDLNQGIANQDLALMRRAADGLAGVDVLLPNLDKISIFEPMRPFADKYGSAIRAISGSAKALRTAIDAGDGPGVTASARDLLAALEQYAQVQPELASWVEQSIEQRRLLLR